MRLLYCCVISAAYVLFQLFGEGLFFWGIFSGSRIVFLKIVAQSTEKMWNKFKIRKLSFSRTGLKKDKLRNPMIHEKGCLSRC